LQPHIQSSDGPTPSCRRLAIVASTISVFWLTPTTFRAGGAGMKPR